VIAGVGPGLGASLARKLAKEGCRLGLLARSSEFLETLSNELRQHGTEALTIPTDVSDAGQVASAFEDIGDRLGPVDLLINNASGSGPFGQTFVDISPESFARGWQVGALGPSSARDKLRCEDQTTEPLMNPAAIAEAYWGLVQLDRSAWSVELDLRPYREKFFE
jgi:NAD(P)-dependent dehydrogenase (short-subunit alcohol dehydrogenase family)